MGINKFGSFLNEKRKEKMTIRELSKKLDISSSYLCDLEQGRKLPPIQDGTVQLYDDLIVLLNLTTEEIEEMYSCIDEDLAENNRTAPDITSYISQNHSARVAFREIKDLNPDKDDFEAVLKILREKTKEKRPVFKDSQIDDIALNLLSSNYPEYLIKPTPVNIEKIIEKEGYNLQEVSFVNRKVLGAAIFKDEDFQLIDSLTGEIVVENIPAGSIIYDEYEEKKSEVRFRTTIAHELGHMVLHKDYYNNEKNVMCRREDVESEGPRNLVTRHDWEEHQANQFASCILIPKPMLLDIVFEAVKNYECPVPSKMKFMSEGEREKLVNWIAEVFNVSKIMAKIRFEKIFFK